VRFNKRLKNEPFGIVLRGSDFGSFPNIIVKSLITGGKLRHEFIICDLLLVDLRMIGFVLRDNG